MNKGSAKHIVQCEALLLLTAMKRRMKNNTDERSNPLYSNLLTLKNKLGLINDLSDIKPLEYLSPFMDVISSGEMIGLITGLALTAVEKFLSFRYLDISVVHDTHLLQEAVETVANTVTNTKFVGTDHSSDEVILSKILKLLDTLMHVPCGYLISDYAVCKIISSCFRICFEPQLSELLRYTAECTLERIVHLLFSRLPDLKEDSRFGRRKNLTINVELSTMNSKSRLRRKMPLSAGLYSEPAGISDDNESSYKEKELEELEDKSGDELETVISENDCDNVPPASPDHVAILIDGDNADADEELNSMDNQDTSTVVFDLTRNESNCNIAAEDMGGVTESKDISKNAQYRTDKGIMFKSDLSNDTNNNLDGCKTNSLKRDRKSKPHDASYGLACVQKLLSNLILILAPENIQFTNHVRTGLTLITAALESGAEFIAQSPNSLLPLIQNELSKHLILLLQSDRLSFFAASARVCFLLFESMRHHLKYQLEMYLSRMTRLILSDNEQVPYEYREVALESVVQLWMIPDFITELYLNYDCDLYCSNLLQDLADLFYKITIPPERGLVRGSNLFSMQIIALDSLLFMINSIHLDKEHNSNQHQNRSINSILQKKKHMKIGTDKFNLDLKDGLNYLKQHGFCRDNNEIAEFLYMNYDVDKKMIGELIGKRNSNEILEKYINQFQCSDVRIDVALRTYLEEFRLPGEAANIEIIIESLSKAYHTANPHIVSNDHAAYIAFYVIVMLNVSQHNSNAKKQAPPMQLDLFKKMLKGDNNTYYLDEDIINQIYDSIKHEEIVMPIEQKGLVKENYLWKRLIRRTKLNIPYQYKSMGNHSYELFSLIWKSSVNAFVYIFETEMSSDINEKVKEGLYQSATIAAHYNLTEIMDKILIYVSKYTNFSSPQETIEMFGKNEKTQLAAETIFELTHKHADTIRDGWKNILDCLINLFKAKLLPKSLIEVEDLISKDKITLPIEEEKLLTRSNESQSVVNWLFSGLSLAAQDYGTGNRGQTEEIMRNEAMSVIERCCIPQLIEDTRFIKEASLTELINALIDGTRCGRDDNDGHIKTIHHRQYNHKIHNNTSSNSNPNIGGIGMNDMCDDMPPSHGASLLNSDIDSSSQNQRDEQSRVFCLELLIRVLLHNSDRIGSFLPLIYDHFYTLLIGAVRSDLLLERTVVAALRLTIQLLRKEENLDQIFTLLEILALTKMSVLRNVNLHIVCGLKDLIYSYAANIPSEKDWKLLLTLLEMCGAGTKLDPINKAEFVSRLRLKEISSLKKMKIQNSIDSQKSSLDHGYSHIHASSQYMCPSIGSSEEYPQMTPHDVTPIIDRNSELSRGYTSDSELYKTSSTMSLDEGNNKWILLPPNTDNFSESPTILSTILPVNPTVTDDSQNVKLYSEHLPQVNQYNIILSDIQFAFKDALTIEKSCEILSHLINDPALITPTNFQACVHTLRIFAEACVKCPIGKYQASPRLQRPHQTTGGLHNAVGSPHSRNVKESVDISQLNESTGHQTASGHNSTSFNTISCSNTTNSSTAAIKKYRQKHQNHGHNSNTSHGDNIVNNNSINSNQLPNNNKQMESNETSFKVSAQLSMLMQTLHCRAKKIYQEWQSELPSDCGDLHQLLWQQCWCPLLQGMARLCCDVRPEVRTQAMNVLQNSLSTGDMFELSATHWEDCFTRVLFPLSASFLESMRTVDSVMSRSMSEISDPRIRAIQILTKVFLQHLSTLTELSTFTALWLTFLEYMDSYMKSNNSTDSLHDAVRETLKNVLLVMYTGTQDRAILIKSDDVSGDLLKLTCDRLSSFLPDLVDELFGNLTNNNNSSGNNNGTTTTENADNVTETDGVTETKETTSPNDGNNDQQCPPASSQFSP